MDTLQGLIRRWLEARGGAASVEVSQPGRIEQAQQGILMFKLAMGAFAGISLIVGGLP